MKNKISKILITFALNICIISTFFITANADGATISFSKKNCSVNDEVIVSATFNSPNGIYAIEFSLNYNQEVLQYTSTSVKAIDLVSAGGGKISVRSDPGENKVTYSFTFKAIQAGNSVIQISNSRWVTGTNTQITDAPGASATLTVSDAEKPGVATLKSLSLSQGTLSPAFTSNRTSYTAKVKYDVTSCKVYAAATDDKATVAVGGKEALEVGKNTRTVTVTAQNGTQKTYTIVITRLKEGEELDGETKPEDNTDESEKSTVIDGVKYLLATDLSGFTLPSGFKATTVTRNGAEVAAAQDTDANYTLYYLKGENSENYQPYTLEADGTTFKKLKYAAFGNNTYIFEDIPENKAVPAGFYQANVKIGDFDISAYKSPDDGYTDFYYLYCFFDGNFAAYRYDAKENVLQRCPEFTLSDVSADAPQKGAGFAARFGSLSANAKVIVIGIAAVIIAAIALVVMLIIRIVKPQPDEMNDGYDTDMFTNVFDNVTIEDGSEPKKETEEKTK